MNLPKVFFSDLFRHLPKNRNDKQNILAKVIFEISPLISNSETVDILKLAYLSIAEVKPGILDDLRRSEKLLDPTFNGSPKFGYGDLGDSPMIESVIFGNHESIELPVQLTLVHKVNLVTCDQINQMIDRLKIISLLIQMVNNLLGEKFSESFQKIVKAPGWIHFVNEKTGSIEKSINVGKAMKIQINKNSKF